MERVRRLLMVCGLLAAGFAGGAFAQWVLSECDTAHAASSGRARAVASVVRARRFELVDARGATLASLGVAREGPMLLFRDKKGHDTVGFGFWDGGVGLSVSPKQGRGPGKAEFTIGVSLDGRYAGMGIRDENGKSIVVLGTSKD